jgi:cytidylate kinase
VKRRIKIAIDGPAASGKSTTARLLADKLGYLYIDTGAMYRALTLAVIQHKIKVDDKYAILKLAQNITIDLCMKEDGIHTYLNGEDVSQSIRLPMISEKISYISAYPEVRKVMVAKQRYLSRHGGIVMEGRDIGTVVLPDAEIKIFMAASLEQRAVRRFKELKEKNVPVQIEQIIEEIKKRDHIDSSRSSSPLKAAAGAHIIDTTNLSIEQQVEKIIEIVKNAYRI